MSAIAFAIRIRTSLKNLATIAICCVLSALISLSWTAAPRHAMPFEFKAFPTVSPNTKSEITSLYDLMNLEQKGLSKAAFTYAYKGYRSLVRKKIVTDQQYLVICDFGQSSNNKRFYVLDMSCKKVMINTYVAHGRKSGGEYATHFSNKPRSNQSSLGFYKTQQTYFGEHGLSLRVKGLEAGYNDKAGARAIVIHGADYIGEDWLEHNKYMGRSYGCPAIPKKESVDIINKIKEGCCMFIYFPSKTYLSRSKILNG